MGRLRRAHRLRDRHPRDRRSPPHPPRRLTGPHHASHHLLRIRPTHRLVALRHADALQRLDLARSSRRYAGGVNEIWPLANDGRIDTLVVEDGHALPARITDDGQLDPTEEVTAPDVIDDIVDETIEAVLRHGGRVVVTEPGEPAPHHHIAAVLRY